MIREDCQVPEEWTPEQLQLYSRVLDFMLQNKCLMVHPAAPVVEDEHWLTTAHNAATLAADLAFGGNVTIVEDGVVVATTDVGKALH